MVAISQDQETGELEESDAWDASFEGQGVK